jgi:recombinational DNA repair protein (RecF pathway)
MRNQPINAAASGDASAIRRCSRCGVEKPTDQFYRNPATICKSCQRQAAQLSHHVRRAAIAKLVARHRDEYRGLLLAERTRRGPDAAGGEQDAA